MAKIAKFATGAQVYQLKITLKRISPSIWRRVQTMDCSLATVHDLIQTCMGWGDSHLHEFEIGRERYGDPFQWQQGYDGGLDVTDEAEVALSQLVAAGVKKFSYTYDMGDSWEHTIQIEKVLPAEAGAPYPRCTAGKRACPPDDCGGVGGYGSLVAAIQDPKHEQHDELLEWVGGAFDPEAFDLDAVNKQLS